MFGDFTRKEYEILKGMFHCNNQKITFEVEEPILDEVERKYLSGVIRPFRDRVRAILKYGLENTEWIIIKTRDYNIPFPYFKKGTMYKKMVLNKEYTLEELGL